MGHDHSFCRIECQGQRLRLLSWSWLGLGSQLEMRSVKPRSSIDDTFLVAKVAALEQQISQFYPQILSITVTLVPVNVWRTGNPIERPETSKNKRTAVH